jgi:DNA topoisomerase-1
MDHKLYLSDKGIYKRGNKFYFNTSKKEVTEISILNRLNKLVVPPAWQNVWYASNKNCHIQVYGTDQGDKRQYILSEKWINTSRAKKFNRMKNFIRDLVLFKRRIRDKNVLINLLFNLLLDTHIRVGNEIYAEQNNTYGLSTLRQRHLIPTKSGYVFAFVGKSNISHNVSIPKCYNGYLQKLIKVNKNTRLFPGITSDILNNYLKLHMGRDYTCKDFRTYSANMLFIKTFRNKKTILESIDTSAALLGHTRNICKKSYISNNLLDYCRDHTLEASQLTEDELLAKVWS